MPATPRPRSRKTTSGPQQTEPRPWLIIEKQVQDTSQQLNARAERTANESRTVGPYSVYCHIAFLADGSEAVLCAVLFNPVGSVVAFVSPLDTTGTLWRHRVQRDGEVEVSTHASLLDGLNAAALEAAERGAWTAAEQDQVEAAYAANPRKPLCAACGR